MNLKNPFKIFKHVNILKCSKCLLFWFYLMNGHIVAMKDFHKVHNLVVTFKGIWCKNSLWCKGVPLDVVHIEFQDLASIASPPRDSITSATFLRQLQKPIQIIWLFSRSYFDIPKVPILALIDNQKHQQISKQYIGSAGMAIELHVGDVDWIWDLEPMWTTHCPPISSKWLFCEADCLYNLFANY